MRTVVLPGTDTTVSRLTFGTASLHHILITRHRVRLVSAALEAGFTHLDTSPYYGFGIAEETIGRLPMRLSATVSVATKVGLYPPRRPAGNAFGVAAAKAMGRWIPTLTRPVVDASVSRAEQSLQASLRRMRREHVEFLFLHEPSPEMFFVDEWLRWFEDRRTAGLVGHYGLAGEVGPMREWIASGHPIAKVLQVRDSLELREADVIAGDGRCLQFTYGYLVAARRRSEGVVDAPGVIRGALQRNATGSVLVSARTREHLTQLAAVAA